MVCIVAQTCFDLRETADTEVVKQGKMRWLHQNELQALLKEELTLKDVSMICYTLVQLNCTLNNIINDKTL